VSRAAMRINRLMDGVDRWLRGKRIWLISANVLIAGFLIYALHYPIIKIDQVMIDGPDVWHSDAMAIAAPPGDSNLFHYDFESVAHRLHATFGARALCDIQWKLPRDVMVRLTPTNPALWTESGSGVRGDGALFAAEIASARVPVWRRPGTVRSLELTDDAAVASGAWAEVVEGDARFARGIAEWTRNPRDGWVMLAEDGRTRIILGWNNLTERARLVAWLFAQRDSILTNGCTIDARIDGRLIVRPGVQPATAQTPLQKRHARADGTASRGPVANNRQGG
jgi:hypothetical protein